MDIIILEYNKNGNIENFLTKLENFNYNLAKLEFKIDRNLDDSIMLSVLKELEKIPEIQNKEILYNERFIQAFYNIFWPLLSKLGVGTQNFYQFIEALIYELNRFTVKDYIIYDCHSTDKYNCGRAMSIIKKGFLIYNTDEKGYMDINT